MEQLTQPGFLRGWCNETVTCIGTNTFCYDDGKSAYCACEEDYVPSSDEPQSCTEREITDFGIGPDATMIGVVIGLAVMSVTLCILMQMFAKARFADNRTIFNTANPRLMNTSLKTAGSGRTAGSSYPGDGSRHAGQGTASETERLADTQRGSTSEERMTEEPTSPV